jgi:hypothetical protein
MHLCVPNANAAGPPAAPRRWRGAGCAVRGARRRGGNGLLRAWRGGAATPRANARRAFATGAARCRRARCGTQPAAAAAAAAAGVPHLLCCADARRGARRSARQARADGCALPRAAQRLAPCRRRCFGCARRPRAAAARCAACAGAIRVLGRSWPRVGAVCAQRAPKRGDVSKRSTWEQLHCKSSSCQPTTKTMASAVQPNTRIKKPGTFPRPLFFHVGWVGRVWGCCAETENTARMDAFGARARACDAATQRCAPRRDARRGRRRRGRAARPRTAARTHPPARAAAAARALRRAQRAPATRPRRCNLLRRPRRVFRSKTRSKRAQNGRCWSTWEQWHFPSTPWMPFFATDHQNPGNRRAILNSLTTQNQENTSP